jgi:dTDP-4-dehydrorhamnose reductase
MKILVTGSNGQLGYELVRSLQPLGQIVAVDRSRMDLADLVQVREVIRAVHPELIVNAAAYTAVDRAESEPGLALRINAEAPALMAEEALRLGAALVHYSTDYVFDGSKPSPYTEDDGCCPLNVYGQSKLAGEQALIASGVPHLILRTSWVYGMRGRNFLLTMLKLAAESDQLRVVDDQHGAPTWCRTVADATAYALASLSLADDPAQWWQTHAGIYHLTAQGSTSWHGFAQALLANAAREPVLAAVSSASFPTPAARPRNSRLCCDKWMQAFCRLPGWREALALCQGG